MDDLKEKFHIERESKQRVFDELGMLRSEIQLQTENEKMNIKALTTAQNEVHCYITRLLSLFCLIFLHVDVVDVAVVVVVVVVVAYDVLMFFSLERLQL